MATVTPLNSPLTHVSVFPADWTVADMQEHLGGIPLERILIVPPPGTATVDDVERIRNATGRICELVDGTLVEKAVGYFESRLAAVLIHFIERFLDTARLGMVLAPDGMLNILSGLVARRMSPSSLGSVCRVANCPSNPSRISCPTWPSKCCPRGTRRPRCDASCRSTSRPACDWCGSSIR